MNLTYPDISITNVAKIELTRDVLESLLSHPDLDGWFDEYIKHSYGYFFLPEGLRMYNDHIYCIWFEDQIEAMFFKLRWF